MTNKTTNRYETTVNYSDIERARIRVWNASHRMKSALEILHGDALRPRIIKAVPKQEVAVAQPDPAQQQQQAAERVSQLTGQELREQQARDNYNALSAEADAAAQSAAAQEPLIMRRDTQQPDTHNFELQG